MALCVLVFLILHSVQSKVVVEEDRIFPNDLPPEVTIDGGVVSGRIGYSVGLKTPYHAFQGIPFAEPPLGSLRFEPPEKNLKWNGTLRALKDRDECVQTNSPSLIPGLGDGYVVGSEDCLYINVYVPRTNKSHHTRLPVMVWIYGGGFYFGNSSYKLYGPDYFLDQEVIFVSFNYRLGVFGFLSTNDEVVPGNNGLKDQVFALKWVQNNIHNFGGDPKSVTIFGESAGSASVSYLLQSPLSKGLFAKAIMESGTSLCIWSLAPKAREVSYEIAESLNISATDSKSLLKGLKNVNFVTLQTHSDRSITKFFLENGINAGFPLGPVVEPLNPGAFFTAKSHQLLSKGKFHKVPSIIGFNSKEMQLPQIPITNLLHYPTSYEGLVPIDMNINNSDTKKLVENKIYKFYFSSENITQDELNQYLSDDFFVRPVTETVLQESNYSPVYFYQFSFEGLLGNGGVNRSTKGVGHAEDLNYLFKTNYNFTIPESDKRTRNRMVTLWTNFAKYGNPTPTKTELLQNITWLTARSKKNELTYLDINSDLTINLNPHAKSVDFWNNLYEQHGNPPYDTY